MKNKTSIAVLEEFKKHFGKGVYQSITVLAIGAILCTKIRTVSRCLRVMGLHEEENYGRYYYALNKAKWSCLLLSKTLLKMVISNAAGTDGILRFNLDDTLVRRYGKHIKLKGNHHDAVRSRGRKKVISQGIRWLSLQLSCKVPWSERYWSLPIMTIACPSKKTCSKKKLRYRSCCELSRTIFALLRRWLPDQAIEVAADNAFQTAELYLVAEKLGITLITRSRADINLYDPAPKNLPKGQRGPKPKKGAKQSKLPDRVKNKVLTFTPMKLIWYQQKLIDVEYATGTALWYRDGVSPIPIRWFFVTSSDKRFKPTYFTATCFQNFTPEQLLQDYRYRWNCEVTFQDLRFSLGLETQRHWSDTAINRITPLIFGLYSIIVLFVSSLKLPEIPRYHAAWYPTSAKSDASFHDILACARTHLWDDFLELSDSHFSPQVSIIPYHLLRSLRDTLAFAA